VGEETQNSSLAHSTRQKAVAFLQRAHNRSGFFWARGGQKNGGAKGGGDAQKLAGNYISAGVDSFHRCKKEGDPGTWSFRPGRRGKAMKLESHRRAPWGGRRVAGQGGTVAKTHV